MSALFHLSGTVLWVTANYWQLIPVRVWAGCETLHWGSMRLLGPIITHLAGHKILKQEQRVMGRSYTAGT